MDASGHAVKFNLSAVMFTTVVGVSVVVVGVSVVVVSIGASVVIVEDVEGVGEAGDEAAADARSEALKRALEGVTSQDTAPEAPAPAEPAPAQP